jgi:HPr kinase/phosphorylase
MNYASLKEIKESLDLEVINKASDFKDIKIYSTEISRPGLQLVGYFEKFVPERLQIMGSAEWHYYKELSPQLRYERIDNYFRYSIPALIISRDLEVFPEILELAKIHDITILRSPISTSKLINQITNYIDFQLASEIRVHGVFVEVYGVGVLIKGKSGVGKSETALDLVIRGHRLISDDTVIIKKTDDGLMGRSPKITRHFMEIRGLGILDIERLYGVGSVKNDEYISMVIQLELWDQEKEYDRIGLDENFTEILGQKLSIATIPVRPGRNVAMIIEVAARNFRQKVLGYNAANELNDRIKQEAKIRKNMKKH